MYGGRSDDLEYMQEVLKTAERLGDRAYIERIKKQIDEIKKRPSTSSTSSTSKKIAKKEEPLKPAESTKIGKLGDRCNPSANRQMPGSCDSGNVCWHGVNRCCKHDPNTDFYDCGEAGISPIKDAVISKVPSPVLSRSSSVSSMAPLISRSSSSVPSVSSVSSNVPKAQVASPVESPVVSEIPIIVGKQMTQSPTSMGHILPNENEKKVINEYFDLKWNILKNIDEFRKLKVQKDKILNLIGYTPELTFSSQQRQGSMDDCIRDDTGKVLQC